MREEGVVTTAPSLFLWRTNRSPTRRNFVRNLLHDASEAIARTAEAAAADRSRATDRSSPRRFASLPAIRAGSSTRRMFSRLSWVVQGRIHVLAWSVSFSRSDWIDDDRPHLPGFAAAARIQVGRPQLPASRRSVRHRRGRRSSTGPIRLMASRVEARTRVEASRNWRRSSSRETDSSSSLSERRMTSALERALSSRLRRRTCACSAGASVNDDFPAALVLHAFFIPPIAALDAKQRCLAGDAVCPRRNTSIMLRAQRIQANWQLSSTARALIDVGVVRSRQRRMADVSMPGIERSAFDGPIHRRSIVARRATSRTKILPLDLDLGFSSRHRALQSRIAARFPAQPLRRKSLPGRRRHRRMERRARDGAGTPRRPPWSRSYGHGVGAARG